VAKAGTITCVDEIALLQRARRGDHEAFSALFARYQRAVFGYAAHMCGPASADDIVQETFMVVLRQHDRIDPPRTAVGSYLLGIARRLVLKRLALSGAAMATELNEQVDDIQALDMPTAFDAVIQDETIRMMRAAIDALPPVYREVMVLCELQELDYAEAAAILGCPIGTVRSRLHRARAQLAAKLAEMHTVTSTRPA
jgi:RNA polymerase sigma-70 factor, ECF subfamily